MSTMKKRILGLTVGTAGLAGLTFLALSGASCSQPAIQCVVAHSPFFATYTLVDGTGSCATFKSDDIGMSTYLQPNATKTLADYTKRKIAIQSNTLGSYIQEREGLGDLGPDKQDLPYGFGDYTADPDANNVCFTGNTDFQLAPAEIDLPEVPAMDDGMGGMTDPLPAVHLKQTWKNIKVYVTADVPGTQVVGDMVYEDLIEGCSATYKFVALAPSVPCEGTGMDGKPNGMPEELLCSPSADPSKGLITGSGINPDFKVHCDPVLLHCVLTDGPLSALNR
jgi:hypothetical protein